MYERKSKSGHTIKWDPGDDAAAKQAMEEITGTGVPDLSAVSSDSKVDLEDVAPQFNRDPEQVATDVQERYQDLAGRSLDVTLDDAQVTGDGIDIEVVTVELVDGTGSLITDQEYTAVLNVDGMAFDVVIAAGVGQYDLSTSADAGDVIGVQAVDVREVDDRPLQESELKGVDVV
jgi:hypothetical protein